MSANTRASPGAVMVAGGSGGPDHPVGPIGYPRRSDSSWASPDAHRTVRQDYAKQIIQEADAVQEVNVEEDGEEGRDVELDAQVNHVGLPMHQDHPGLKDAVEHLRGMLTISYLDEQDLPPRPSDGVWQ